MAGLVFLLVFWVLAGACQRHGVGGFLLCNSSSSCFLIVCFVGANDAGAASGGHLTFGRFASFVVVGVHDVMDRGRRYGTFVLA